MTATMVMLRRLQPQAKSSKQSASCNIHVNSRVADETNMCEAGPVRSDLGYAQP
jgi:hypothetical protein